MNRGENERLKKQDVREWGSSWTCKVDCVAGMILYCSYFRRADSGSLHDGCGEDFGAGVAHPPRDPLLPETCPSVVQCISHSTNLSLSSRVFQALRWVFSYISEQHEDLYLKEIVVWRGLLPVTCRHWMNRSLSSERSLEAQDQAPRLSWPSSRRSGWSVTM